MKEKDEDSETQTKSRISFGSKQPPIIHIKENPQALV
jgi:hypothetical protein